MPDSPSLFTARLSPSEVCPCATCQALCPHSLRKHPHPPLQPHPHPCAHTCLAASCNTPTYVDCFQGSTDPLDPTIQGTLSAQLIAGSTEMTLELCTALARVLASSCVDGQSRYGWIATSDQYYVRTYHGQADSKDGLGRIVGQLHTWR